MNKTFKKRLQTLENQTVGVVGYPGNYAADQAMHKINEFKKNVTVEQLRVLIAEARRDIPDENDALVVGDFKIKRLPLHQTVLFTLKSLLETKEAELHE